MNKLPTVSIGIPAHNESKNIQYILRSLLEQNKENYILENIIVYCDGCEDNTAAKVLELAKNNRVIKVVNDGLRKGKIGRLKELYLTNSSDIVINFDADTLPADKNVVKKLVSGFSDKTVVCVFGNIRPIKERTLVEKLVNIWNIVWYEAVKNYKNGQTINHASSAAMAVQRDFAKNIAFPNWAISDGAIVYLTAKKYKFKTKYVADAIVLARSTGNVKDYLMLLGRYSTQRGQMNKYFGQWVTDEFYIPKKFKYLALLKVVVLNPILGPLALAFQVLAMKLAKNVKGMESKSFWKETRSTKTLISEPPNTKSVTKKPFILMLFCILVLALSIRGLPGNPSGEDLLQKKWQENGPFELSVERGRFALTYSIIEDKTLYFSTPIARFSVPDLGYINKHYVSLFAPGVSILVTPGFVIGQFFGASQFGTFAVIAIFAVFNFLLIRAIAIHLNASETAANLGALTFLFASPAFSYAVTLYQHHVSTFLILMSLYLLVRSSKLKVLLPVWLLIGAAIPIDYPNLVLLIPVGLFSILRLVSWETLREKFTVKVRVGGLLLVLFAAIPISSLLLFNKMSYDNALEMSGTVPGVREINKIGLPVAPDGATVQQQQLYDYTNIQQKSALFFFHSRALVNGLYIHLLSPDRGIINFTPVILLGLFGSVFLYRKNKPVTVTLLSIVLADTVLYSLWGDPWGGWAFGSRYLIPGYACMAILLAVALSNFKKKTVFLLLFLLVVSYSVIVNTAGALTSSANPPQVEILALEKVSGMEQKYTYQRNLDTLRSGISKSFFFRTFGSQYLSAWEYFQLLGGAIILVTGILVAKLRLTKND